MALIRRRRDGALLVAEAANPSGAQFHRPLGGHVEFGEYALETVHREFHEEIGQALTDVRLAAAAGSAEELIAAMMSRHGDRGNPYTLWTAAAAMFAAQP
jgi:ADP-ribose pyrophosphatase YjhB (NUDIX family)